MTELDLTETDFEYDRLPRAEPEDYTGEDGLLYCGKCHTAQRGLLSPKKPPHGWGVTSHPAECDCQRAEA